MATVLNGDTITTGVVSADNFKSGVTSEGSDSIDIDFSSDKSYLTRDANGTITLTSSNHTAGSTVTLRIKAGASARTISYSTGASSWVFVGTKPSEILANKTGVLTVTSFGTTADDCVAAYSEQE
jgi:hypothetical protein